MSVPVGVLDSGLDPALGARIAAARRFGSGEPRPLRHGAEIGAILARYAPHARFLDARVFLDRMSAPVPVVAEGLRWLVAHGARVLNLSLGLRQDHPALRAACAAARERGCLLVASTPPRGPPVYPAAYPGVLRVCGDARCAPGEISCFGGEPADWGASPRPPDALPGAPVGGSSYAVAYVSARIAEYLHHHPHADGAAVLAHLRSSARYHGRERRHG